ncbi:MAG TPA: glycoside hydrolase family 5 protein, partial [Chloroflexota bacterium]|nr:glycoside hydrolase family 5 protein [Chloroflexota bacterium]
MAKLNYLHTDGNKIKDSQGNEVLLAGVNWFGMETDTLAPHGIWTRNYQDMLDQIVSMGFNCIRLPFSNELFDPALTPNGIDVYQNKDLKGLTGVQILDKIVVEAGKRGLKIILDQHRPTTDSQSQLWYTVELSEEVWIQDWVMLAKRYLGNDTIIGADLHNEPSGDATWGSDDPKTDWPAAVERCGNAIHKVNPHWLIIVEGIEKSEDSFGNIFDWTWQGGELISARVRPIKLNVPNRVVYSAHDYGPSLYMQGWFSDAKFPKNLPTFWDFHWGYLHNQGIAPVLVGEFGGDSVGTDMEGQWQRTLVDYLKSSNMHYTYWAFNANSADTGGLLEPDWKTVNQDKLKLLKQHQGKLIGNKAPDVVNVDAVPPVSTTRLSQKALHFDDTLKQWITALKPELYIANKTLKPMDLSKHELRYWFAPNGDAALKEHAVSVGGTTTENFGKILSGGQVNAEIVAPPGLMYEGNPLWYVKVTFAPGVTAPARDSIGFGLQIARKDQGQYFQPSHYSYRDYHWPSEWKRLTMYVDDKLVWGEDPMTYEETEAAKQRAINAQRAKFMSG